MVIAKALFSSASGEHTTPKDLFDRCNDRWGPFTLDAAATPENALCPEAFVEDWPTDREMPEGRFFHTGALDSNSRWAGRVWCNPPYGRKINDWVRKAWQEVHLHYCERVVMLLPVRTDTHWWQLFIIRNASEVHFLKGRLKFSGAKNSAPFPSAIVVFERPFE